MPRLSIECSEDKLITLIPILLKEGVKCMVSPDKITLPQLLSNYSKINDQEHVNAQQTYNEMMSHEIAKGQSVPRNTKHVFHIKERKLTDIVLEYFIDNTITLSSGEVGKRIAELGFKDQSASSTLNALFVQGKLTRIREGHRFYYSLSKSNDPNI